MRLVSPQFEALERPRITCVCSTIANLAAAEKLAADQTIWYQIHFCQYVAGGLAANRWIIADGRERH